MSLCADQILVGWTLVASIPLSWNEMMKLSRLHLLGNCLRNYIMISAISGP
jgi:hypothetical protein